MCVGGGGGGGGVIIILFKYQLKFRLVQLQLTLYALMGSSFRFDALNLGWSIVYIEGSQVKILREKIVFLSLKIVFVLANSVYQMKCLSSVYSLFAKVRI